MRSKIKDKLSRITMSELVYESLVEYTQEDRITTLSVERTNVTELLGIQFTKEPVSITKDGRITLPELLIVSIGTDSIGEKIGLKVGSVIKKINDVEIDTEKYFEMIKENLDFEITVNNSYCLIFQSMLNDPILSQKFTFHY